MRTKQFRLSCLILALCFLVPLFTVPVTANQAPLTIFVEGVTEAEIDAMAIDPQSWQLQKDMTWDNFVPNPVVNWLEELNPEGLRNPSAASFGRPQPIAGGLLLVDYLDRKFISGLERDDVLGFFRYAQDGSGYDYESGHIKNPIWRVQDFPEQYPNGYDDLKYFWHDYLNDPEFSLLNHGVTINGYWREASYGKWAMTLEPHGVYTIPFFEFEMAGGMGFGQLDVPPSFRHNPPTGTTTGVGGDSNLGRERLTGFTGNAVTVARYGAADAPGMTTAIPASAGGNHNSGTVFYPAIAAEVAKGVTLGGLSRSTPAPFANWDFYFVLHAGYCTSGSWQPFGQLQAPTRQGLAELVDPITGEKDYLNPAGRLRIIEEFFNAYPEWIPIYAKRYENGWGNSTGAWNTARYNTTNAPGILDKINNVYRQTAFWVETLAAYNAALANDTLDEFVFALPQEDWDWAASYHGSHGYTGLNHTRNTRYVSFTSWEGSVGEWSAAATTATGGGNGWGALGQSRGMPRSVQGENSGSATFIHEFGHVAGWLDNYQNPYTNSTQCYTEYWDVMSRGSFSGPFGDLARWSVPGVEGGSVSTHPSFQLKERGAGPSTSQLISWYDPGDVLVTSKTALIRGTPVVGNIVARNIPLDTQYNDFGVPRFDPATGEGFHKAMRIDFGSGTVNGITLTDRATRVSDTSSNGTSGGGFSNFRGSAATLMSVEVVEQTGYDSYAADYGVMLQRASSITTTSNSRTIVEAHAYDIDLVDYFINDEGKPSVREGDWYRFPVCHAAQQLDALFKAGKSYIDTGYYGSIREINNNSNVRQLATSFSAGHHDSMGANGKVLVPGSVKRGEDRYVEIDGVMYERPITAGDSVNEWLDEANGLHFYILDKFVNEGKYGTFLSYQVAVRHTAGQPVDGDLIIEEGAPIIPAKKGNYVKQTYSITNTGSATDIVRVTLEGPIVDVAPRFKTIKVPHNGGLTPSINEGGNNFTFNPNNRQIYIDRVVSTFFSEQNAVIFNDLYAIGAGETIEIDVWVKTVNVTTDDFDVTVTVSSETNAAKTAQAGMTVVTGTSASAYVVKVNGNKNDLYVTVNEFYSDGTRAATEQKFIIDNNAAGNYIVDVVSGSYTVYVDTKGNTQIRACQIVACKQL